MKRLILDPGGPKEQVWDLPDGLYSIGRTRENDIAVLEKSLSRRHALIELTDEEVVLKDLGSKNGTFVNGDRLSQPCTLAGGETIKLGDLTFAFIDAGTTSVMPVVMPSSELGDKTRRMEAVSLPDAPVASPTVVRELRKDLAGLSMQDLLGGGTIAGTALFIKPSTTLSTDDSRDKDKLQILLKVSQALSSPEGVESLLKKILDLAFQILDIDRAAILLVEEASDALVPRIVKTREGVPDRGQIYSNHIVDYVRNKEVAALFSDAASDPRLDRAESVMFQSIRSSMCAPLKPRDKVLGVLYVDNLTTPDRFSAEDVDFLSAFASQAAIAIENSFLYSKLENEAMTRGNLLRFFPPAAAAKLMDEDVVTLEAVDTEITALFSDICGFTAMSSSMTPREIVEMLNEYFPVMAEIVFQQDGTLEKYIGDALLAVWGAPFSHDDDADRALRAAVKMQHAMQLLNARWSGRRNLQIHIGLNTGPVAAGNIGSDRYIQYATIGDATNVASRVCGVATAGEIVIAEATRARLLHKDWPLEKLKPVKVKGKTAPLLLYRVLWELD